MASVLGPKSLSVLVVDDDEVDRASVRRALKQIAPTGFQLAEAVDRQSGLALLGREHFDCALIDYRLPDGDARAFLGEMKELDAGRVPIIVLTGLDDQSTALQMLHDGAEDYLIKGTFSGDMLLRSIRYAVERFRIRGELERANGQLERLAFLDPLTQVFNRRGLEHMLPAEVARAGRNSAQLYGVLIDCDDFKSINERFGHAIGDRVLVEIADRIRVSIRQEDHFARIGGDEFLVLLSATGIDEATRIAERVRAAVASENLIESTVAATISLGVFLLPRTVASVTEVLTHSPEAMRNAKQTGKNRVSAAATTPCARRW